MPSRRIRIFVLCIFFLFAALLFGQQVGEAKDSVYVVGARVLVDPGHHPATVLDRTAVSCRVHYEDHAYPDGWVQQFMLRAAESDKTATAPQKNSPPSGKYTCGVFLNGRFTFTQYVSLSAGSYESSVAGAGTYHYDAGTKRLFFDSGKFQPLFGSYEPQPSYPMFRLSSRNDAKESEYTRSWRSQVCSGKYLRVIAHCQRDRYVVAKGVTAACRCNLLGGLERSCCDASLCPRSDPTGPPV